MISFKDIHSKLSNNERYSLLKSNKDIYNDQKSDHSKDNDSIFENKKLKDMKKRTS